MRRTFDRHHHRLAASLAIAALLTGCASNAIVLDRGRDLSQTGAEAVAGVKTYLDDVQRRRIDSNVALVAGDPGCAWGSSIRVAVPVTYRPGQAARSICLAENAPDPPGYKAFKLSLAPISKEALAPTLALVAGLADYLAALDLILEVKTPDIGKEVEDAKGKLDEAAKLAGQLGVTVPSLASLGQEQVTAITGLVQLFTDLAVEANKARDLRRLDASRSADLNRIVTSLRSQLELWKQWTKSDGQQTVMAYDIAQRAPWRPEEFASRQALILALIAAQRDLDAIDPLAKAVTDALARVVAAEADLRRVLSGKLNEAEKRQQAALIRQRIWRTLTGLGAIAAAF